MLRKGMIWMPMDKKAQLAELISNAETSFYNGQLQEAFSLSLSAIKLDENCADAYQCAANVCMSLNRYEDAIEYYQKVQIYIMIKTQIEMFFLFVFLFFFFLF